MRSGGSAAPAPEATFACAGFFFSNETFLLSLGGAVLGLQENEWRTQGAPDPSPGPHLVGISQERVCYVVTSDEPI